MPTPSWHAVPSRSGLTLSAGDHHALTTNPAQQRNALADLADHFDRRDEARRRVRRDQDVERVQLDVLQPLQREERAIGPGQIRLFAQAARMGRELAGLAHRTES